MWSCLWLIKSLSNKWECKPTPYPTSGHHPVFVQYLQNNFLISYLCFLSQTKYRNYQFSGSISLGMAKSFQWFLHFFNESVVREHYLATSVCLEMRDWAHLLPVMTFVVCQQECRFFVWLTGWWILIDLLLWSSQQHRSWTHLWYNQEFGPENSTTCTCKLWKDWQ